MTATFDVSTPSATDERVDGHYLHRASIEANLGDKDRARAEIRMRFMRASTRGMHRYRTDKEFSKRVLGKYGKITDDEILEGTWQDYAPTLQKSPRPSLRAIQFLIEYQFQGKKPLPKPEQFVGISLAYHLEKSGVVDSVYK